ncbi:uncharacterized protein LOC117302553 [Asterias rubens]|uniref:uncharacterized protein LOC117302553 n=1 Tax=Asterias rubens TaxID=7604 RepID=UPI001455D3F8|nr:uncharacterized protein LOC117302553 [Asterias rubens]
MENVPSKSKDPGKKHKAKASKADKSSSKKSKKHDKPVSSKETTNTNRQRRTIGQTTADDGPVLKKSRRGLKVGSSALSKTRDEKVQEIKDLVENMDEDCRKKLLSDVAERMPGVVLNLIEQQSSGPPPATHPPASTADPGWCVCGHCREMPTDAERLCCRQVPQRCISTLAIMQHLVLDHHVLELARLHRNDMLGQNDNPPVENDEYNRRMRHSAYRQFVLWQHGRLGAGNRVTIPSCCVWKIRDTFPDRFGQYTGFIPNRPL